MGGVRIIQKKKIFPETGNGILQLNKKYN